ncbi:hypothetical protein IJI28_01300 [Candidatus Saccharibacteria bacterium]|nr:hypothetical protein [Candidatus Saccharibacteria bacterium]
MKKSIIATGAASLALAAMPVVGVFAVDTSTSTVTDEIVVTVPSSCAITSTQTNTSEGVGDGLHTDNSYAVTMQNGELRQDIGATSTHAADQNAGSAISIACNDTSGTPAGPSWSLTAQGGEYSGDTFVASTEMDAAGSGTNIQTSIAEGSTTGTTSSWAMKVNGATGVSIANSFDNWHVIPGATNNTIATGNGAVEAVITPVYRVYIGTAQETDTYTGHVTYTLTSPSA